MAGPASEAMILEAEKALGVRFSPSYRAFLEEIGAALGPGYELFGLAPAVPDDETPLWTDVVATTRQTRQATRGLIPHEYVVISDDGGDYTFYLDTSGGAGQEHPVVVLGPGADGVVVAADFAEFVVRSATGTIDF